MDTEIDAERNTTPYPAQVKRTSRFPSSFFIFFFLIVSHCSWLEPPVILIHTLRDWMDGWMDTAQENGQYKKTRY